MAALWVTQIVCAIQTVTNTVQRERQTDNRQTDRYAADTQMIDRQQLNSQTCRRKRNRMPAKQKDYDYD